MANVVDKMYEFKKPYEQFKAGVIVYSFMDDSLGIRRYMTFDASGFNSVDRFYTAVEVEKSIMELPGLFYELAPIKNNTNPLFEVNLN